MTTDIFLVDDDAFVRESLQQALELTGWKVQTFSGMESALATLEDGQEPMVIVTDLRLGKGDGLQLLRAVRCRDPKLPVVLITGHGDVTMAVRRCETVRTTSLRSRFPRTN